MEKTPKRKLSRFRVSDDRISNLPEPLICHILSFLPTKTAVATSVLSKTWKFHWTKVTSLDFSCREFDEQGEELALRAREFVRFVNKVLLNVDSQCLQKFRLQWWKDYHLEPESVAKWISFAVSQSIRVIFIDLRLGSGDSPSSIPLPGTIFIHATLEVLKIYGSFVFEVPSAVSLPKLEVLDLRHILFKSNECLPRLILACPVLHTLKIGREVTDSMQDFRVFSPSLRHVRIFATDYEDDCEGKLEIDAPNLEYFSLSAGMLEECLVKRVDSLNTVVLNLDVFPYEDDDDGVINEFYVDRCNSTVKLVEAMNRVKSLTLRGTVVRALSDAETTLPDCFDRLIELDVSVECCHWSSLGDVLGRSAKLQVLQIAKDGQCKNTDHKFCWNNPTKVPECLSSSLQKVSLYGFNGLEDEMKMIKYILNHGEVLESLTLKSYEFNDYKDKYELQQRVATFSRCSRACQLHF